MDTYTLLRSFADSWWLIAMVGFFVGVSAYALRPGSRAMHADIAAIPLRNDSLCDHPDHPCVACGCRLFSLTNGGPADEH